MFFYREPPQEIIFYLVDQEGNFVLSAEGLYIII